MYTWSLKHRHKILVSMIKKHNMIGISYMYVLQISAWVILNYRSMNEKKMSCSWVFVCECVSPKIRQQTLCSHARAMGLLRRPPVGRWWGHWWLLTRYPLVPPTGPLAVAVGACPSHLCFWLLYHVAFLCDIVSNSYWGCRPVQTFNGLCARTPQLPTLIIIMMSLNLYRHAGKLGLSRRLPGRRWGHYWLSFRQPLNPSLAPWRSTRGHTHLCKNAIASMISIRLPCIRLPGRPCDH